ncbi:MAG: hypothetical protein BZY81_07890 [SAR202 cluster bacterium Io17-Chloro-G4]|nr:MAG: hypothetical protein BZY81_07890 [SAR202 cluster bacterium Io17-Chloro-G4]
MLKLLAKGLFGRFLSYGAFTLGFWLLFQGFSRPEAVLCVLGGAAVLLGMYLMVQARKSEHSFSPPLNNDNNVDSPIAEKIPETGEK